MAAKYSVGTWDGKATSGAEPEQHLQQAAMRAGGLGVMQANQGALARLLGGLQRLLD